MNLKTELILEILLLYIAVLRDENRPPILIVKELLQEELGDINGDTELTKSLRDLGFENYSKNSAYLKKYISSVIAGKYILADLPKWKVGWINLLNNSRHSHLGHNHLTNNLHLPHYHLSCLLRSLNFKEIMPELIMVKCGLEENKI